MMSVWSPEGCCCHQIVGLIRHVMMRRAVGFNHSIVHEVGKKAVYFLVQYLDKALTAS